MSVLDGVPVQEREQLPVGDAEEETTTSCKRRRNTPVAPAVSADELSSMLYNFAVLFNLIADNNSYFSIVGNLTFIEHYLMDSAFVLSNLDEKLELRSP